MRYLLVFLLYLLSSCKQKEVSPQQFTSILPKNIDTTRFKESQRKFNVSLQLNDISTGVDSFEIRFRYNYALLVEKDLFIIRYINGIWEGLHYSYQRDDTDSIKFVKKNFTPIIPWKNLVDSIYSNEVLNIPSQDNLDNYKNKVADGHYFNMEYATKNKFKIISYENPKYYPEFKESKIVLDFIDMFYRNISAKELCWPRCI